MNKRQFSSITNSTAVRIAKREIISFVVTLREGVLRYINSPVKIFTIVLSILLLIIDSSKFGSSLLVLSELIINVRGLLIKNRKSIVPWAFRLLISRLVTWGLILEFFIITENNWMIILLPIVISWYVFEPSFIGRNGKSKSTSFSERFSYFIERYPFFIGYGIIPSLIFSLYFFDFISSGWILLSIIQMIFVSNEIPPPAYLEGVPYFKETWPTDILDYIESYFE